LRLFGINLSQVSYKNIFVNKIVFFFMLVNRLRNDLKNRA
jgi:hypothetical protein